MSSPRFLFDTPGSPYGVDALAEGPATGAGGLWVRLGYLLSALLLAGAVLAGFNPTFGFQFTDAGIDARRWPWDVFAEPGRPLGWTREVAWIVVLGGAALALFTAAWLRSPRARAGTALVASALLGLALLPPADAWYLLPGCSLQLLLAVLTAAAAGMTFRPRPAGAVRMAFVGVLVSAALLLLPLPKPAPIVGVLEVEQGYRALGPGTVEAVADLVGKVTADPRPVVGMAPDGTERLADLRYLLGGIEAMVPQLCWCLGLVVGLLVLLRLGGRWALWVLGFLLLAALLLPPFLEAWGGVQALRSSRGPENPLHSIEVVAEASERATKTLLHLERILILPLALALADWLRSRRTTT